MRRHAIVISPLKADWPAAYREIAAKLRAAAGEAFLTIHPIGSTAVPGLGAKDVIDIQITVTKLDAWPEAAILAAGFTLAKPRRDHAPPGATLPPDELAKRLYNCLLRPANVHVRQAGRFNQRYPLLCRDYLRAHPAAAAAYGEIKQALATRFSDDVDAYYAVKDPVFDLIMAGAEDWARSTGWRVPPSD
jgi:GrpB-like predicted nucleotidyltransferase (UPF0157 family)